MSKMVLALVAVTVALAVAAGTAGASTGSSALAVVPVTGTTSTGDTFTGTMTITDLAAEAGQVVASGTLSGTATDAAGQTVATMTDAAFAAPVQQQGTTCTLLSFSIGPIDLDAAGLVNVHIEPIGAKIALEGILGTLLCGLLGTGTPAPVPA